MITSEKLIKVYITANHLNILDFDFFKVLDSVTIVCSRKHIQNALNSGLHFIIIVDKSHQNNTNKADEIIQYFNTNNIIRCSATHKGITNAEIIEIPVREVNSIVLNNADRFKYLVCEAMVVEIAQLQLDLPPYRP